jgi:SAM-dependent methyltransferase
MKDSFSTQAGYYAQYRPDYPEQLYDLIFQRVEQFDEAWDCATGNGQVAKILAKRFGKVHATDISEQQLMRALPDKKIAYQVGPAEKTMFKKESFDLITVAQALHWFDHEVFFDEVMRLLKPGGVAAFWAYGLNTVNEDIDFIVKDFYEHILRMYWDPERKHVDNEYINLPFPDMEWQIHHIDHKLIWKVDHYLGYLSSWSAVQNYIKTKGKNPVDIIKLDLEMKWGREPREIIFPIFMRVGKLI